MKFLKIKMIVFWEMLMDAAIVNNPFKENFDEKKKKNKKKKKQTNKQWMFL